ncbi:MAG TPA: aminopeptidase P N-terminal domain-containing protein [Rectinemataceae bacterium]|nr:aminopeptidase P N-terminal domain-containing protein [Rectinemataceae bacterium]
MFEASVYARRREALRRELESRGVERGLVILIGNGESPVNYADNAYPFRQDSTFLYFVGTAQPGLAATIDLASGSTRFFGDDLTMNDIVWTGPRPTMAALAERSGISETLPRSALAAKAAEAGAGALLYLPSYRAETRLELAELTGLRPVAVDAGASLPLVMAIAALRELKSEEEVAELEHAVAITTEMHRAALATARAGMRESDVAARVTQIALAAGGALSFPVIATTRGATLHNHSYDARLAEGGLFLLDAGAEVASGYAGDLTTTFPISARFDTRQKEVYEIVLSAHAAACAALAPGVDFLDVHLASARAVAAGLKDLGLIRGDPREAVAAGAHALFYPHGIGHMIGLDVHDMESYGEDRVGYADRPRSSQFGLASLRLAKPLKVGMVHSVEPGLYFIPELIAQWKAEKRCGGFINYDRLDAWSGFGGVRNEEDWLVTPTGARKLGPAFDKSTASIESLRD